MVDSIIIIHTHTSCSWWKGCFEFPGECCWALGWTWSVCACSVWICQIQAAERFGNKLRVNNAWDSFHDTIGCQGGVVNSLFLVRCVLRMPRRWSWWMVSWCTLVILLVNSWRLLFVMLICVKLSWVSRSRAGWITIPSKSFLISSVCLNTKDKVPITEPSAQDVRPAEANERLFYEKKKNRHNENEWVWWWLSFHLTLYAHV